jgi:PTH1 family peptidyl-tRNA hydrolase
MAKEAKKPRGTFLVVGLGNPGREYRHSRHNVGYEAGARLSERHSIRLRSKRKLRCRVGVGEVGGRRVVLALPTTFMNRSGEAVARAVGYYGVAPKELLVMVDDVNLPLGQLRIRRIWSDGGHNGLRSVIAWLGTEGFPRLRIGIGKPVRKGERGVDRGHGEGGESLPLRDFVLGNFGEEEREVIGEAIERATEAVEAIIEKGVSEAMGRYNRGGGEDDRTL